MPVSCLRGISGIFNKRNLVGNIKFSDGMLSGTVITLNGLNTYTALHEIAQINIAKAFYNQGDKAILEYEISSTT